MPDLHSTPMRAESPTPDILPPTGVLPPVRTNASNALFVPGCFTFFLGLLFLLVLTAGIATWYHPDTESLVREASALLTPIAAQSLAPEPTERLQFVASLVFLPPFLFVALLALTRFFQNSPAAQQRRLERLARNLTLGATAFVPVFCYLALKRSEFLYLREGLIFTHFWFYTLIIFPATLLLTVFAHRRWGALIAKTLLYAMTAWIFAILCFISLFDRDSISEWTHHINPVIYPVAQVVAGKTLLVDCAPLYGLYPHFLQPIFSIVPLGVYSFTFVMAALLVVSCAALWGFLRLHVRNDVLLLAGFSAATYYSHFGAKTLLSITRADPYFQYAPIRLLFPCLLLLLAALYLRGIAKSWVYAATFLCASIALLWNPDSGIVVFGGWILFLGYTELSRQTVRESLRPILLHGLAAIGSLVLVFGGFALFAFLRSGMWPDWRMSADYYKLFSHYGYFMLPMAGLPHSWGVVVAVYIGAMIFSFTGLVRKDQRPIFGSLFLLSILGAGLFAYYQGRSHDFCLFPLLYLPVLIITLICDHLLRTARETSWKGLPFLPLGILFFFFTASAAPSVIASGFRLNAWIAEGLASSVKGSEGPHSLNVEFIQRHTTPGEKIMILLGNDLDGIYDAESSTRCVLDLPSSTDWFYLADHGRVVRFLKENKATKLFLIPSQLAGFDDLFRTAYRTVDRESQTGLTLLVPANCEGSNQTSLRP